MLLPLIDNYRALNADTRDRIRLTLINSLFLGGVVMVLLSAIPDTPEPLPDFSRHESAAERKAAFFEFITPFAVQANNRVLEQREKLQDVCRRLREHARLSRGERRWLYRLSARYRLDREGLTLEETCRALLRRVDRVPVALVVVQAAKESGWGRSFFAREGNNLFGEWCYQPGCGIVPRRRVEGARHEVRAFASVEESVASYLLNINSHPRYRKLREIRAEYRRADQPVTALALAEGLMYYSERREAYVKEVRAMIRQYHHYRSEAEI